MGVIFGSEDEKVLGCVLCGHVEQAGTGEFGPGRAVITCGELIWSAACRLLSHRSPALTPSYAVIDWRKYVFIVLLRAHESAIFFFPSFSRYRIMISAWHFCKASMKPSESFCQLYYKFVLYPWQYVQKIKHSIGLSL